MDNFSLTRHVRHRTIGSWELASRSTEEGWGNALSGARPVDTAPTQLGKTSRTKNLITEFYGHGAHADYACQAWSTRSHVRLACRAASCHSFPSGRWANTSSNRWRVTANAPRNSRCVP